MANWNDKQSSKAELRVSLESLDKEVSQNMGVIEKVLTHYEESSEYLTQGRGALDAYDYSPEGHAALKRSIYDLTQDVQLNFVTIALDQLASQGGYAIPSTISLRRFSRT